MHFLSATLQKLVPIDLSSHLNLESFFIFSGVCICSYLIYKCLTAVFGTVDITKDLSIDQCHSCSLRSSGPLSKGDVPPFYPNGWIPVIESNKLNNDIQVVKIFGGELVVFRGSSGHAFVLDAFCPHLGAHLGFGGRVLRRDNQDCIKCPFHGWIFRTSDGRCVDIPDSENTLLKARIKVWKSLETNGFIYIWYHADNEEASWYPEDIPEIKNRQWIYRGRTEHVVSCFFQEIPENGADVAHLSQIHKPLLLLGGDLNFIKKFDFVDYLVHHKMEAAWTPLPPPKGHVANMKLKITNFLFNFPFFTLTLEVLQIGPATVHLRLNSTFFNVKGIYIQNIIPIGPKKHRIIHHLYTDPSLIANIFSKFLLFGEAAQLERDIFVWNRKAFLNYPLFAKQEKPLLKFRRWFRQFYSDNSKSLAQRNIDW